MKQIRSLALALFFYFTPGILAAQSDTALAPRYTKTPTGYLMVLRQGDSLFTQLEQLMAKEKIPSASFSGLGFLSYIRFGFFNAQTKQYDPKDFTNVELASLTGSLAWEQGKPSIHAHGTVTDKNMTAYGGHILTGRVGTGSIELFITVYDQRLERAMDPAISAKVLQLPAH